MNRKAVKNKSALNVGIVGFGLSGQVFHAPFIEENPNFNLHTIATSQALAARKYRGIKIADSIDDLLADPAIDLVVICTPNALHYPHAKAAVLARKHVIIEKPFSASTTQAQSLIKLAGETGKFIFPYHNRRWDSDFLTLKQIIAHGSLGEIVDYESRFDRFAPEIVRAAWKYQQTEGGGTLFDLGTHLIDQAINLFGKPEGVFCQLFNQREGSVTDDSFDLRLIYPGLNVTIKASVFVKEAGPRFQVHGTKGSFIKYGLHPQEAALKKDKKPGSRRFGIEPVSTYGILNTIVSGKELRARCLALPGDYMAFYDNVYSVIAESGTIAIEPEDALLNLLIIEAARKSDNEKKIILL